VLLQSQKQNLSDEFYELHRRHLMRVLRKSSLYFLVSGTFAALFILAGWSGKGTTFEAVISVAVFLWICYEICAGVPGCFQVRLLPYFERRLGDADTWDHGRSLAEHSRKLDALAIVLGATPLSRFASGDDLISNEKLVWFETRPELETTGKLLQSEPAKDFPPDLASDLSRLQAALRSASDKQVRFCLLRREGSSASGAEMERRKGSFF
jgi:hypothetical protein